MRTCGGPWLLSLSLSLSPRGSSGAVFVSPSLPARSALSHHHRAHCTQLGAGASLSLTHCPPRPAARRFSRTVCCAASALLVCVFGALAFVPLSRSLRPSVAEPPQGCKHARQRTPRRNPAGLLPHCGQLVHYLLLLPSSVPSCFSTDIIYQPHCLGIRSRERLDTIPTGRWWLIPVSRCPPLRCV